MNELPLHEQMKDPAFGLDDGIRDAVVLLNQHGIETHESCEGGVGHSYTEPTVAFSDDGSKGMHALGVCLQHGLPVSSLQQVWQVSENNTIHQIVWRIVFFKKVYYGRGEPDEERLYLRGNVIMRAYANDMTEEQWQQIKQVLNVGSVYD